MSLPYTTKEAVRLRCGSTVDDAIVEAFILDAHSIVSRIPSADLDPEDEDDLDVLETIEIYVSCHFLKQRDLNLRITSERTGPSSYGAEGTDWLAPAKALDPSGTIAGAFDPAMLTFKPEFEVAGGMPR